MGNPVTHFEIIGSDGAATQHFYGELFEWTIDAENPMRYGIVDTGVDGIGGGVAGGSPDGTTHVMFYVEVADVQATLDKVEAMGGRTVMPPMEVPGGPSIAQFADPDGLRIGLIKAT